MYYFTICSIGITKINISIVIVTIIIAILLSIIAVKFMIWLLPIIIVVMLSIIIYSNIKMNKNNTSNKNDNIKEVFDYKDKK